MAAKFPSGIDLTKTELQNMILHLLATAPSSPGEGQFYYNTADHEPVFHNGTTWKQLRDAITFDGTAKSAFALLASPAFTGVPTTPTAAAGTNTTQIASTAYVITEIAARLAAGDFAAYKGAIDASGNPNYPAANAGDTYRISVAGKIGGGSGINVEAGDLIMSHVDSSAGGTQASVGADWDIIQTNIDGAVTLTGTQTLTNKTLTSPVINTPTGIVKGDVGLGNVDNTSDATKNAATVTLTNKTLTSPVINTPTADIITSLTAETAIADSDLVMIYDASATALRKMTKANFVSGLGGGGVGKYSATIGDNSATSFNISQATHGRAADSSNNVFVEIASTGERVYPDITVAPGSGQVTIAFAVAPTTNQYRVHIHG